MQTSYIRKTCVILIALVLVTFSILACKAIITVNANYEPPVDGPYVTKTVEEDSTIDETISEINSTVAFVESELLKIQESSIVEEFDDYVWTTTSLHFREYPSVSGKLITTLAKNTKLHRIGVCQNGWYYVVLNDVEGYVHCDYVTSEEPITVQLEAGKEEYQAYALSLFSQYGWSDSELEPLIILWNRESNWNPLAENQSSGAYGIPQSLPGDKMAQFGDDWRTNYKTQIQWGLWYIDYRYGTPTKALDHSYETGWY